MFLYTNAHTFIFIFMHRHTCDTEWFCVWAFIYLFFPNKISIFLLVMSVNHSKKMAQSHKTLAHLWMESISVKGEKHICNKGASGCHGNTKQECHLRCKLSCAGGSDGTLLLVLWRRSVLFMERSLYTTWHTFNMDYFTQFIQLDSVQDFMSIYGSYFIHFLYSLPIHTL